MFGRKTGQQASRNQGPIVAMPQCPAGGPKCDGSGPNRGRGVGRAARAALLTGDDK